MMIGLIISFAMVQISPYPVQAKKTSAKDNLAITFFDGSKTHHIVYTKSGELKVKKWMVLCTIRIRRLCRLAI
jgi:hypothetical protein